MGLPAYYGVITSSIVAYFVSFIICLVVLHFKYGVDYEDTVKHLLDVLCGSMLMVVSLFIMKLFIPVVSSSRIVNLFIIIIYAFIGGVVYLIFMYKNGVFKSIFGNNLDRFLKKKK